jgi:hypothetical protein
MGRLYDTCYKFNAMFGKVEALYKATKRYSQLGINATRVGDNELHVAAYWAHEALYNCCQS